MNNKERMELAKWASEYALKKGAKQSSVSISRSRSVQLEVREQKVETIKESTENNLSVQIFRDNKYSSHSTNNLNKSGLEKFISEAVEATSYLSPDADRQLPDPALYPNDLSLDLKLFDPTHQEVTPEYRIEQAMKTEQLIRDGYKDLLSASARFSDNFSEGVRFHSNGFEGETTGTFFNVMGGLTILDGAARPEGGFYAGGRFLNMLPTPEVIAEKALADTLRQRGQKQMASGKYNMIVENSVASNLVWRLFQPMQGRSIQQKNSFLLDKINTAVASEFLTITDDPFLTSGMASRLFDSEGIAAKKRVMIEKGILKAYYIDNYYGRKLGTTPNGGSTSNIVMGLGNRNPGQIIAAQDKAILVTSFNGGNANTTTGDFSFGISGQYIEKGEIVRPVNEMNITGNFLTLWGNLVETGNDPFQYSSLQSPTLVFKGVDFSGL